MKNRLELTEQEKRLMDKYVHSWDYTGGDLGTLLVIKLKNGFEVMGTSDHGLLSQSGYGRFEALRNALDNLDQFVSFEKHQKAYNHYLSLVEEKELNEVTLDLMIEDMKKVATSLLEKSKEVSGAEAHRMTDQEFRDNVIGKKQDEVRHVRAVANHGLIVVAEDFVTLNKGEKILPVKNTKKFVTGSVDLTIFDTKSEKEIFKLQNIPSSSIELNVDGKEAELAMKEDVWLESRYGYRVRPTKTTGKATDIDFAGSVGGRIFNSKDGDTDVHLEEEEKGTDAVVDNSPAPEDEGDSLTEQLPNYNSIFISDSKSIGFKDFPPTQKEMLVNAFARMLDELEVSGKDLGEVSFSIKVKGKDEE